jgi:hypothetical protein
MDELTSTFLGLMDYLQAKYNNSSGMVSYIELRELGTGVMDPRRKLERLILQEWCQGIPPYVGLKVPGYLHTLRLPCEMLQTLFENIPTTMGDVSKEDRWVQLSLSLTAPFQTKEPTHVRDMRRPRARKLRYRNILGLECRDRGKLIDVLTDALVRFDIHAQIYQGEDVLHPSATALQAGINGIKRAEFLLMPWGQQRRFAATFEGTHVRTVRTDLEKAKAHLQALISASDTLSPLLPQTYIKNCYYQLLLAMKNAFKDHGPREKYPAQAIYLALSEILSPLLRIPELALDSGCTTEGAISQRLGQRLPHA